MRFRHTILCLAVILSCLTYGSDMAHGQSPALQEAAKRSVTYYRRGQYSEALLYATEAVRMAEEELGTDHPFTATVLDNLAQVVRERFKIRRQVRVHTAHGRMTGYVMLALPAFLTVALSFINPDHVNLLFQDRMGQMMLGGAIALQTIGYLWIRQVVKIEV